jgi:hypothetical protein
MDGHDVVEPLVAGLQPAAPLQVEGEALPRVVHGQRLLGRVHVLLDRRGQDGVQQLGAGGEAAVQGGDADPGAPRDLLQRRLQALLGEHLPGRGEDGVAVALGVAAQPSGGRGRHRDPV